MATNRDLPEDKPESPNITVTASPELKAWARKWAKANHRSLSAQILHTLEAERSKNPEPLPRVAELPVELSPA